MNCYACRKKVDCDLSSRQTVKFPLTTAIYKSGNRRIIWKFLQIMGDEQDNRQLLKELYK